MEKKKIELIDFSAMTKEEAVKAIEKKGFSKIQKEDIRNYLAKFEAGESREWLKEAYKAYSTAKLVDALDDDGKPIPTGKTDKDGKEKTKKRRKAEEGGNKEVRYSHNTAKNLFFKHLGLETKKGTKKQKRDCANDF